LQDGDTIEFSIDAIGSMHLHVSDPAKRTWDRGVDEETAARARSAGR